MLDELMKNIILSRLEVLRNQFKSLEKLDEDSVDYDIEFGEKIESIIKVEYTKIESEIQTLEKQLEEFKQDDLHF